MSPKPDRRKLSEIIRETLGSLAPPSLLVDRAIIDAMIEGAPAPRIADLLVNKVVKLALDPDKANQWAVELIFDRVEGKASPVMVSDQEGRQIDERIENVSVAHLNSLAKRFVETRGNLPEGRGEDPENKPAGQVANSVVGMPDHEAGSAQNA